MSQNSTKPCPCTNCQNPACACAGASAAATRPAGQCCCGATCTCGPACQCPPSCGCPATAER